MAGALCRSITQLNLFNTYSTNSATIQREITTTRLYIVLLSSLLVILVAYSAQKESQRTLEEYNPSIKDYQRLFATYPATLSCPCSQLTVPYSSFLTLTPIYHPVCSSDFVSDRWLSYLYRNITSKFDPIELRAVGHAQFQFLRFLCESSKQAIESAFETTFALASLSDSHGLVMDATSVEIRAKAFAQDFAARTANEQQRRYLLLSVFVEGNFLWSAIGTNAMLKTNGGELTVENRKYEQLDQAGSPTSSCLCETDYTCNTMLYVYNNTYVYTSFENPLRWAIRNEEAFEIPGFRVGCSPFGSLLLSTLECYNDQTCLDSIIDAQWRLGNNFTSLNPNASIYSSRTTPIGSLAEKIMVDNWRRKINYSNYFSQCRPLLCSYSYSVKFNILYIIATLAGVFGGLTVTLRFLSPRMVNINNEMRKQIRARSSRHRSSSSPPERLSSFRRWLRKEYMRGKNALLTGNLYARRNTDIATNRKGIISTRLYIVSLLSATLVLTLVIGLDQRLITVIVTTPSVAEFTNLLNSKTFSLSCPCSKIAIAHSTFLSLTPVLHQICSSDFLSDDWMDRLAWKGTSSTTAYNYLDIRSYGSIMFRAIRTFCTVSNTAIIDALAIFNQMQLISPQSLSREQFQEQVKTLITEFQSDTPSTVQQLSNMTREIINGNQLLSTKVSNFFIRRKSVNAALSTDLESYLGIKLSENDTLPSCSCLLDTCSQPLGFYNWSQSSNSFTLLLTIPGMWSACYPLDGLRKSTLECWFNETCISLIRNRLAPISVEQLIPALNPMALRRFTPSTSISSIINELMVEDWSNKTDYEAYYSTCQPLTCTYTYFRRLDWLYSVSTVAGLLGGLTVSLRIICLLLVKLCFRLRSRFGGRSTVSSANSPPTSIVRVNESIVSQLRRFISLLNVFDSDSPHAWIQQRERESTRLYVVSLSVIIVSLFTYMLFIEHGRAVSVRRPSSAIVARLQDHYSSSLSCPCSQAFMPYSTFLSIKMRLVIDNTDQLSCCTT